MEGTLETDVRERSALLVMDVQNAMVGSLPDAAVYLARLRRVVTAARQAEIPVIYVVVRFRDGYPTVGTRNKSFSQIKGSGRLLESNPDSQIADDVAPRQDEV